jgi:hypothetical protein
MQDNYFYPCSEQKQYSMFEDALYDSDYESNSANDLSLKLRGKLLCNKQ